MEIVFLKIGCLPQFKRWFEMLKGEILLQSKGPGNSLGIKLPF